MGQEREYDPNEKRTFTRKTVNDAEYQAQQARADVANAPSLGAAAGETASAADPDEPKAPPAGSSLGVIAAFAEAKRKYKAAHPPKTTSTP